MEEQISKFFADLILLRVKDRIPFNLNNEIDELGREMSLPTEEDRTVFKNYWHLKSNGAIRTFLVNHDYIEMIDGSNDKLSEKGIIAKRLKGHDNYIAYINYQENTEMLLKESTLDVNKSLLETNEITKQSLRQQAKFTKIIMWSTVATALIAGLSLLKDLKCSDNKQSVKVEVQVKHPTQLPLSAKDTFQNHPLVPKRAFSPKK